MAETQQTTTLERLCEKIEADSTQTRERSPSVAAVSALAASAPPPPRNVVICCDGTNNEFGEHNTNVVTLYGLLQQDDPDKQIAYYDPGVGTFSDPGMFTWLGKWFTKAMGLAFSLGITRNIEDAYRYLMEHHRPDDRVFLFGFSRGAYTVRALAGMLSKVGLLKRGNENQVEYATKIYRTQNNGRIAAQFKQVYSRECRVHFVGVWDTVKSVGFLKPRVFPNAKLNTHVSHGRHALAIDEKRIMFRPTLWGDPQKGQTIEQVWFPGVHANVGGGFPDTGLSDRALLWMLEEADAKDLLLINGWQTVPSPNPAGKLVNMLIPIWWVLPFWPREVPQPGTTVDPSVEERKKHDASYGKGIGKPVPLWRKVLGFVPGTAAVGVVVGAIAQFGGRVCGAIGRGILAAWNGLVVAVEFLFPWTDSPFVIAAVIAAVLYLALFAARKVLGGD